MFTNAVHINGWFNSLLSSVCLGKTWHSLNDVFISFFIFPTAPPTHTLVTQLVDAEYATHWKFIVPNHKRTEVVILMAQWNSVLVEGITIIIFNTKVQVSLQCQHSIWEAIVPYNLHCPLTSASQLPFHTWVTHGNILHI